MVVGTPQVHPKRAAMIAAALFGPIPGMVASRSRWRAKGTIIASTWASSRAIISFKKGDVVQVQLAHQRLMIVEAALQRLREAGDLGARHAPGQIGQHLAAPHLPGPPALPDGDL